MRPQIPSAFSAVFVLFSCSCWRLACFLFSCRVLAVFLVFLVGFFGCPLAAESGVQEHLKRFHSNLGEGSHEAWELIGYTVNTFASCFWESSCCLRCTDTQHCPRIDLTTVAPSGTSWRTEKNQHLVGSDSILQYHPWMCAGSSQ